MAQGTCSVEVCDRPAKVMGLCSAHWQRLHKYGTPGTSPVAPRDGGECAVEGCLRKVRGQHLCGMHNARMKRIGNIGPAGSLRIAKPTINRDGYRLIPVAGSKSYRLEHRMVMEEVIGRSLGRSETVHHRNGDRLDNRPENLELWSTKHVPGQRVEDQVAWAKDILFRYGGIVEQLELLREAS